MIKKYIGCIATGALLLNTLSGCNDFLDRKPLDKVIPENYFSSESDLAAYTINTYSFLTVDGNYGINLFGRDNDTDNQASSGTPSFWVPGQKKVPSNEGAWTWEKVRACNYFFDNVLPKYEAGTITGAASNVSHYLGEMYVIRAYNYYQLLSTFGDLPIVTTALPDKEEVLLAATLRQPRNKVARFILDDLQKASELLLDKGPGGKNRISKNVAHLLRARVALFEATWEKYHKGTAFVPGGPGWAGNAADIVGFDIDSEISYFLGEAMASAKVVGDYAVTRLANNTDTAEGMNASLVSINPYYMMFCDENMETYDEVLMWRQFKEGLITNNLQMELARAGGDSGWTRGMVNSFLMRNGLPHYANGSGFNPEWEKEGVNETLQDRDSRISIFTKKPGDVNYYAADGSSVLSVIDYVFGNKGSVATTGFIVKKGKHYSNHMANDHNAGTSGGIVFRAAEALLIYMEASCEKNNGTIDATADSYWKALRRRAKVDEDYTKTIAATIMSEEAKGDLGAYSQGDLIGATLYNIRRERRNELCAEAFRWEDLKRWRACDQLQETPYRVEGMLYWGSKYEVELSDKCIVDPEKGNMSSPTLGNYIVPYEKITSNNLITAQGGGFRFTPAHYLEPIGMAVFNQTAVDKGDLNSSVVYQNPGWLRVGDTAPLPVK